MNRLRRQCPLCPPPRPLPEAASASPAIRSDFRPPDHPRRFAGTDHARLLPVLARDRHAAAFVVAHGGRRRHRGIYRHAQGIADRLPVRARDSGADLSGVFLHHARSGAHGRPSPACRCCLFFYLFTQFAVYRARRYRLTRTIWRGVRFWMTGSGWAYAFRAFAWSILVGLTLGLAMPWQRASLERYKMRHTYYGDLQGSFRGDRRRVFQARLVALASRSDCSVVAAVVAVRSVLAEPQLMAGRGLLSYSARAVRLRPVQSHRMALVGVRIALRRRQRSHCRSGFAR